MTVLLALAICAAVVWVLVQPFRERRGSEPERGSGPVHSPSDGPARSRRDPDLPQTGAEPAPPAALPARAAAAGHEPSSGHEAPSAEAAHSVSASGSVPARDAAANDGLAELRDEKERLLTAIADLRFDFETGKLSPADYELEDTRMRRRAAEVIRSLEGA